MMVGRDTQGTNLNKLYKEDNKCIYKNLRLVGKEDSCLTYPTFEKNHLVEKKWLNDHRAFIRDACNYLSASKF